MPRPPYLSSSTTTATATATTTATAAATATATATSTTATSAMASPPVLSFDAEGRPIKFETWLDDLHLFLQLTAREYDHALGTVPPPATTAAATARSQWQTRDAHARFAIRNSLPVDEREHFGQHQTAQALYTAVVARYSSPASAALGRLSLPYLFPDLGVAYVFRVCIESAHYTSWPATLFSSKNVLRPISTADRHELMPIMNMRGPGTDEPHSGTNSRGYHGSQGNQKSRGDEGRRQAHGSMGEDEEEGEEKEGEEEEEEWVGVEVDEACDRGVGELLGLADPWAMSGWERRKLVAVWVEEVRATAAAAIEAEVDKYASELQQVEDLHVLRRAQVVGMTTSGVAKMQRLITALGPRAIILEKAAELRLKPADHAASVPFFYFLLLLCMSKWIGRQPQAAAAQGGGVRPQPKVEKGGEITILTPYVGQLLKMRQALSQVVDVRLGEGDAEEVEKAAEQAGTRGGGVGGGEAEGKAVGVGKGKGLGLGFATPKATMANLKDAVWLATVDNFQGEESTVIIISLVRHQPDGDIGFLKSPNRTNVLLSRAKHGMYIVGACVACAVAAYHLERGCFQEVTGCVVWLRVIDMV
ncbi:unnamed protein product [Closterium sp. NIES-53]